MISTESFRKVSALAEDTNSFGPVGPGKERIVDRRFVLWLGGVDHPAFTVVQRLRLQADEVEETVEEVRALLRGRRLSAATWEVGWSATPAGLGERLLALGMVPDREHVVVPMVLESPPPEPPPGIEVRRASSLDDLRAAAEIGIVGFDTVGAAADEVRAKVEIDWAAEQRGDRTTFLALVDGEPAAFGVARFSPEGAVLGGGATLPAARGRGAYRALVLARWREAERRGAPGLVVQAGSQSRPILGRLGFRPLGEVRIFLDQL
jgi:hypothetical protein